MSMNERIQQRLDELGLSPRAASLEAGLNSHFLQKVLANTNKGINSDSLIALAKVLEVKPGWLLTGEGDKSEPESAAVVDIWDSILDESQRKAWVDMGRSLADKDSKSG